MLRAHSLVPFLPPPPCTLGTPPPPTKNKDQPISLHQNQVSGLLAVGDPTGKKGKLENSVVTLASTIGHHSLQ